MSVSTMTRLCICAPFYTILPQSRVVASSPVLYARSAPRGVQPIVVTGRSSCLKPIPSHTCPRHSHAAKPTTKLVIHVFHRSQTKKKHRKRNLVGTASLSLSEFLNKHPLPHPRPVDYDVRLACPPPQRKSPTIGGKQQHSATLTVRFHLPRRREEAGPSQMQLESPPLSPVSEHYETEPLMSDAPSCTFISLSIALSQRTPLIPYRSSLTRPIRDPRHEHARREGRRAPVGQAAGARPPRRDRGAPPSAATKAQEAQGARVPRRQRLARRDGVVRGRGGGVVLPRHAGGRAFSHDIRGRARVQVPGRGRVRVRVWGGGGRGGGVLPKRAAGARGAGWHGRGGGVGVVRGKVPVLDLAVRGDTGGGGGRGLREGGEGARTALDGVVRRRRVGEFLSLSLPRSRFPFVRPRLESRC